MRRDAGSIAILALWGLAIIGILLAVAIRATDTELRSTQNAVSLSRARLAAEAGAQLGLARLLRRHTGGARRFDGVAEHWQDGTTPVDIAIIDEAGKIDLNQAPLELLSGLLTAVGRPSAEALLLACNILDWRGDSGDGCPEPFDAVNRPHLFLVPEELAQVPGFGDALYDQVADYVTVATKASAIDPFAAQRPVLLAIPGATAGLVDAYLDERNHWHDLAGSDSSTGLRGNIPDVMTSPGRDFTIKAIAAAGRIRYRTDLQVRLTDLPKHPYEFVATRAPPPNRGVPPAPPPRRVP
jgi:general secretion pathway protein K